MAYAYVKSGGTATGTAGKYETAKTGSWSTAFTDPSQYYGNISACVTSASLSNGDFVFVSNLHNHTYTVPASTNLIVASSLTNLKVISINDTDLSTYSLGAKEYASFTSAGYGFNIGFSYCYGMTFECNSKGVLISGASSGPNTYPYSQIFEKCTFVSTTDITYNYDSRVYNYMAIFLDCTFDLEHGSPVDQLKTLYTSYCLFFRNCEFIFNESTDVSVSIFGGDGALSNDPVIECLGCNFSQANRVLFNSSISNYSYNGAVMGFIVDRCLQSTNNLGSYFLSEEQTNSGYFLSNPNKNSSLRYFPGASSELIYSTYRDDGATINGIDFCSLKVITSGTYTYSKASPFTFKLLDFYLDTSTTKTFTVEIAQVEGSSLLTDYEFSIDVYYIKKFTSKAIRETTTKILPSSNNLSTSSKTWTGLTNPVKQYVSLTTSQTGSYGLCSVYVNIFVPNRTIYICPKVDIT